MRQYCVEVKLWPTGRSNSVKRHSPGFRYVRRDLTFEQDAAQRNWTAATPVCCQIVAVERLAGLQPVALRSSRHTSHRAGCEGDDARGWPHRMQDQSRYPD